MARLALALALLAACGRIDFDPLATGWTTPVAVFPGTSAANPSLTGDLLEMYFDGDSGINRATRATATSAWSAPELVPELQDGFTNTIPEVSSDGLRLYMIENPTAHIVLTTRPARGAAWTLPAVEITELESAFDGSPVVADDQLALVMPSARGTSNDLYASSRTSPTAQWSTPVLVPVVNSPVYDSDPSLTPDQLALYFRSDRDGTPDLFVATRATSSDPFSLPQAITELDTDAAESDPWISPDQHHLFFASDRDGVSQLYESTR